MNCQISIEIISLGEISEMTSIQILLIKLMKLSYMLYLLSQDVWQDIDPDEYVYEVINYSPQKPIFLLIFQFCFCCFFDVSATSGTSRTG